MPTVSKYNRKFDARPDRIDYRDRIYQPLLECLPPEYPDAKFISDQLPKYTAARLILDQGTEGACTGFGLAAVVNYLLWKGKVRGRKKVSPNMLYQLARVYDEWPGEDYEGSSCRGAMKGWFKHGVCSEQLWPYGNGKFVRPKKNWDTEAARRPLGAYYRINKDSVADMQAAIYEVGAIYCSALVHDGWFLGRSTKGLPMIVQKTAPDGGHAFAIVGYRAEGFIIQNSWGPSWGYKGFALLPYTDWIENGSDAWAAVLGAPMKVQPGRKSVSHFSLDCYGAGKSEWFWSSREQGQAPSYRNPKVAPYTDSRAYELSVVLGNDGRPLRRLLETENGEKSLREVAYTLPDRWCRGRANPRVVLFVHGGLNDEEASVNRARVMAPYFIENGIYPLFINWKTGFGESIENIISDAVKRYLPWSGPRAEGLFDDITNALADSKDRGVEMACQKLLVKAVWTQMKQNAEESASDAGGMKMVAGHLAALKRRHPGLGVHIVGHSAGSILLGHFLDLLPGLGIQIASATLYAPACTVAFANEKYGRAIDNGSLNPATLHFDILTDERERADSVGPYGKSLVYLISRALENVHKKAILGMEAAWNRRVPQEDLWHSGELQAIRDWRRLARAHAIKPIAHSKKLVSNGVESFPLAHGSFDNDIDVVTATLHRILGGAGLTANVENLKELK